MRNIWPTAHGLAEFPDSDDAWYADACMPDAILMGMHVLNGTPLTDDEVTAIRSEMLREGLFEPGGTTLDKGKRYVERKGYAIEGYASYGTQLDGEFGIHKTLRRYSGKPNAGVIQIINAGALLYNEGHVGSHFVADLGIDSVLGYYIGNGDDVLALAAANGHGKLVPMRWIAWDQKPGSLVAAHIMGVFFFSKPGANPEPPQVVAIKATSYIFNPATQPVPLVTTYHLGDTQWLI